MFNEDNYFLRILLEFTSSCIMQDACVTAERVNNFASTSKAIHHKKKEDVSN